MAKRILSENHSPEYLRECFSYNSETGILTWRHRPREHFPSPQSFGAFSKLFAGKEAGSTRKDGYKRVNFHGRIELCHRLAWTVHYGKWPVSHIDHINQNPSDNRIENLRDVSAAINHRNVKMQKNNTSGACGVVWVEKRKAWIAQIKIMGKYKRIGQYRSFESAVSARLAAQAAHGFTDRHGTRAN